MIRDFDQTRDRDALHRIWQECGWISPGDKKEANGLDAFTSGCAITAAELDGSAECVAMTMPGTIRHGGHDLPLCAVTGVLTSRVARKQLLASHTTARAVARAATQGAAVAALYIFDQGYYNRLGFGNGSYIRRLRFDPATLRVPRVSPPAPRRIGVEEWQKVHANRLTRLRRHGAVTLSPAAVSQAEMLWSPGGFGLGYERDDGTLSHHLWCSTRNATEGPYQIDWLAFESYEQLLELLWLMGSLGDQVRVVSMIEPAGVQLQDLLDQPFRHRQVSFRSQLESRANVSSMWQLRICDLPAAIACLHTPGPELRFNLELADPIVSFLEPDEAWRGVEGSFIVTLGDESHAVEGSDPGLPSMVASVNAFSRLWLGIVPAFGLALTDSLAAPASLITALDARLLTEEPLPDWSF